MILTTRAVRTEYLVAELSSSTSQATYENIDGEEHIEDLVNAQRLCGGAGNKTRDTVAPAVLPTLKPKPIPSPCAADLATCLLNEPFVRTAVEVVVYTADAADFAPCPTLVAVSFVARAAFDAEDFNLRNIEFVVASTEACVEWLFESALLTCNSCTSSAALARYLLAIWGNKSLYSGGAWPAFEAYSITSAARV